MTPLLQCDVLPGCALWKGWVTLLWGNSSPARWPGSPSQCNAIRGPWTSVVFLPRTHNPSDEGKTSESQPRPFYKTSHPWSSSQSRLLEQVRETVPVWTALRRPGDSMCGTWSPGRDPGAQKGHWVETWGIRIHRGLRFMTTCRPWLCIYDRRPVEI